MATIESQWKQVSVEELVRDMGSKQAATMRRIAEWATDKSTLSDVDEAFRAMAEAQRLALAALTIANNAA